MQNNRIKVLPNLIINQIAAGEVIERPASVIKELLENSIDANSTIIRVYLEHGGISSIKVIDNGDGVHAEDLSLVFLQHATSKISAISDLDKVSSLGFRGEALASIASVAKTNIISSQIEPHGTAIEVKDLFYNIPARRKFLRSSTTEFNYALEIFKRIALSNFSVKFILYHNNKLIKNLSSNIKEARLAKLCGKKFVDNAIFFEVSQNGLELSGWISKTEAVAGSSIQYLYINNRVVKDRLFSNAIRQATVKLSLPQAYCIYLTLDPSMLDVNVHPTKQEVRFRDPKVIYAFVYENILEILSGKSKINNLLCPNDLNSDISIIMPDLATTEYSQNKHNDLLDIKLFPIFNNKYVIFEQKPLEISFLCVVSGLRWLINKKLQQTNALSSFQLIIPERIKIDFKNIDNIDLYINLLSSLKFGIDQIHDDILLIRAIPDYLNILKIDIDYQKFFTELLLINSSSIFLTKVIELIANNINKYDLYNKKDFIFLITELNKEKFCFAKLTEQQFSKLLVNKNK
jgi:DNA mismatch repair ATPase MutL